MYIFIYEVFFCGRHLHCAAAKQSISFEMKTCNMFLMFEISEKFTFVSFRHSFHFRWILFVCGIWSINKIRTVTPVGITSTHTWFCAEHPKMWFLRFVSSSADREQKERKIEIHQPSCLPHATARNTKSNIYLSIFEALRSIICTNECLEAFEIRIYWHH